MLGGEAVTFSYVILLKRLNQQGKVNPGWKILAPATNSATVLA